MVLEKILESPLDCKEIQPVHPKGDQSWVSLEELMLKLKLQYFGHLMQRTDSFEKTLMLGKIEGRRRRERQLTRCLEVELPYLKALRLKMLGVFLSFSPFLMIPSSSKASMIPLSS